MDYEALIKHYGSLKKAAARLDMNHSRIGNWKCRGIPMDMQRYIQLKTRGKLKASEEPTK